MEFIMRQTYACQNMPTGCGTATMKYLKPKKSRKCKKIKIIYIFKNKF